MSSTEKKLLPLQFVRAGLVWNQVQRTHDKALYAGSLNGKIVEWECIRVRTFPGKTIFGTHYVSEREKYPSSSDWGTYGFTHNDKGRAYAKYESL